MREANSVSRWSAAVAAALAVLLSLPAAVTPALAGQMTPPAGPADAGSAMWTLQDLYDQATTGAHGAIRGGNQGFQDASQINALGTMRSLNDLMTVLPARASGTVVGAPSAGVCRSTWFWGLLAPPNWGLQQGTLDCTPPAIGAIGGQSMGEDDAPKVVALALSDNVTAPASLAVTATAANQAVLPASGVSYAPATQQLTLDPATSGSSTVTVRVTDAAGLTATASFTLTVTKVNHAPTVSAIPGQTTTMNVPTSVIPFTVGDDYTTAGTLAISALSSDTAVIPLANIVLGGAGAGRTVTVTPAADRYTTATPVTVTLRVSDGDSPSLHTDAVFTLAVSRPIAAAAKDWTSPPGLNAATVVATAAADCTPAAGATLRIESAPARGTAVLDAGRTQITYTPATAGSDSFEYLCVNGHGAYDAATVSILNR